jgi:leucyl aminopeptidase
MLDNILTPSYAVKLAAEEEQAAPLVAEFHLSSEKPAVGQPGKKTGDLLLLPQDKNKHAVIVSLGLAEKFTPEEARKAGGALGKWLLEREITEIAVDVDSLIQVEPEETVQAALEGIKLGAYQFTRHKNGNGTAHEITVWLRGEHPIEARRALAERVQAITDAVILARDLGHEPANVINPVSLTEVARLVAEKYQLNFKVLDERQLAAIGAGAILGVGQGSQTPPRLIVLEYPGQGAQDEKPVVLVGKAITFDTGGYSIKDVNNIVGMKYDKCGGLAVLATMQAAAALKLNTPVVGIIGAAENMISAQAYRPDDILTTMSGKTVEIISTDAEGRLVLADAITYAQREHQPRVLVDLATLTGGVLVALGRVRAGLLCNDDTLASQLYQSGEKTHERLWRLPLDEEYALNIKGDDSDLKNSGGREGHCILGGAFIQQFVEPGTAWAHLDIAGTASSPKDLPYAPKGATGFGVRLLIDYLENL